MKITPQNLAAFVVTLGLCASSAYAATTSGDSQATSGAGISSAAASIPLLARKGADDPRPETGCDDHGTDICHSLLAKKGADDLQPDDEGCDDHGTDICLVSAPVSV